LPDASLESQVKGPALPTMKGGTQSSTTKAGPPADRNQILMLSSRIMVDDSRLAIEDPKVLTGKLQEILVSGSLYRNFVYIGKGCHFTKSRDTDKPRYGLLPSQLKMYCEHEKCKTETLWDVNRNAVDFGSEFINHRFYSCRNCSAQYHYGNIQYYDFVWQENEASNIFVKVGQWPPLTIEPSPELAKALGSEDTELYKKGLIGFNFGHGIGAVAYFRRVLENKINALLDLIEEAARNAKVADEHLARIETVKKSHRVEEKIDIASGILPAHLKPGGHNPLDKLYGPLSAGLHGESDDDCLTIFSEARFVFEYLFRNLTESNEEARKYVLHLSAAPKVKKADGGPQA
jgi:hypothetical protein